MPFHSICNKECKKITKAIKVDLKEANSQNCVQGWNESLTHLEMIKTLKHWNKDIW